MADTFQLVKSVRDEMCSPMGKTQKYKLFSGLPRHWSSC